MMDQGHNFQSAFRDESIKIRVKSEQLAAQSGLNIAPPLSPLSGQTIHKT